jgi:outer membrane protein, heavy metal efflux system
MRQDILPRAQRAFDAAVTGFEAGKFNFLDVLDAQRTLLQIRTQYIQAQYDRYRAVAELGRYVDVDGAASNHRISQ